MRVYDDWQSLFHTVLGLVAGLLGFGFSCLLLFLVYEVVEYLHRRNRIVGDLIEYLLGVSASELVGEVCSLIKFIS